MGLDTNLPSYLKFKECLVKVKIRDQCVTTSVIREPRSCYCLSRCPYILRQFYAEAFLLRVRRKSSPLVLKMTFDYESALNWCKLAKREILFSVSSFQQIVL